MPYVDDLIPWESHKQDCSNPVAKRLYIRDYDKNGKQCFVPWGVTCKNCGVILKQEYHHNLTKKQLEWKKKDEEWESSPGYKEFHDALIKAIGPRPKLSKEELERRNMEWRKKRKLQQRKRKMLGGGRMSRQEMSYRQRVRHLKRMYENDCYHYKVLKNIIHWDQELVEKYLATRPSVTDMDVLLRVLSPLKRDTNKQAKRLRGFIPDPDKTKHDVDGRRWYKRDRSHYYLEDHRWRYNSDPNMVGEFEKVVIKEAEERQRWMKSVVRDYDEKERGLKTLADLMRLKHRNSNHS